MNEKAHIVMVTHGDRAHYLERTIGAVLETAFPHTLTVAANAPGPDSLALLRALELAGTIRLVVNWKNLGFAVAANQAWRQRPEAEHCCHLGDDMLALEPDWLTKLVDIIECCPEVGIVGHSVEPWPWPIQAVGNPVRRVQVQPSNIGGCLLMPKRTREICGYYNEEMGIYGEEDALYGWKVRHAGLLCAYYDFVEGGRSFEHIGEDGGTGAEYRAWKDTRRLEAIPIRDNLMREYAAGLRPLNQ